MTKTLKQHEDVFIHIPKAWGVLAVALIAFGWFALQVWAWDGTLPQPPEPAARIDWLFWGKAILILLFANAAAAVWAWSKGKLEKFIAELIAGLFLGLILGLIAGLILGLFLGLIAGLG